MFARFRFADLFIRYSLRLLLAGMAAVTFLLVIDAPLANSLLNRLPFPKAAQMFMTTAVAALLLLVFASMNLAP